MIENRRRRRRIHSLIKPEEQKPSLPAEESRSKIETEEVPSQVTRKGILVMRKDIDEIRGELVEEERSDLLESDYWAPINLNK